MGEYLAWAWVSISDCHNDGNRKHLTFLSASWASSIGLGRPSLLALLTIRK